MPALRPISGHSLSLKAAFRYFTKKERSLATDYINCEAAVLAGREVWEYMDETRHLLGTDKAVKHTRRLSWEDWEQLDPKERSAFAPVSVDGAAAIEFERRDGEVSRIEREAYEALSDDEKRRYLPCDDEGNPVPHDSTTMRNATWFQEHISPAVWAAMEEEEREEYMALDADGNEFWPERFEKADKRLRTYEHFVLSPDPRDNIDLETLRELAVKWTKTYFGDFQSAIFYHDDNTQGIPHAHIVINNVNINSERHGRISTLLTDQYNAKIFAGLQRMAADDYGLHAFTTEATSVNHAQWAALDEQQRLERMQDEAREHPKHTSQSEYRTRAERGMATRGADSWKEDTRNRLRIAMRLSQNLETFKRECKVLGLRVEVAQSKKHAGELKFYHPSSPTRTVTGDTLGRNWSQSGIDKQFERDRRRGVSKPSQLMVARFNDSIGALSHGTGMSFTVLGYSRMGEVTAQEVLDMMLLFERHDIKSRNDFKYAISEPMAEDERDSLREAWETNLKIGYLPQGRDRIDGARIQGTGSTAPTAAAVAAQPDTGFAVETPTVANDRTAEAAERGQERSE